jgi:hypothetical protein
MSESNRTGTSQPTVGDLLRQIVKSPQVQVYSGGPTLDQIMRDELKPLLKEWLDTNLPGIVERMVRIELERIIGNTGS